MSARIGIHVKEVRKTVSLVLNCFIDNRLKPFAHPQPRIPRDERHSTTAPGPGPCNLPTVLGVTRTKVVKTSADARRNRKTIHFGDRPFSRRPRGHPRPIRWRADAPQVTLNAARGWRRRRRRRLASIARGLGRKLKQTSTVVLLHGRAAPWRGRRSTSHPPPRSDGRSVRTIMIGKLGRSGRRAVRLTSRA